MWPRTPAAALAAAVAAVLGCGACAGASDVETPPAVLGFRGEDITALDADLLPASVLGLTVQVEDVAERLTQVDDTYVEALSLFSLRRADLLMATLQVARLGGPARPGDEQFQRRIVHQLGGTVARELRLGDHTVWLSTGTKQRLQSWFVGDHLFVLTIRADYERPRTLLRQLLEVAP